MAYPIIPPRQLFLIDSVGALTSGLSLLILSQFARYIGLEARILQQLALIAFVFCLNSGACYVLIQHPAQFAAGKHRWPLRGIAVGNLAYCAVTATVVIQHTDVLQPMGWLYFVGEMGIIVGLAAVELRASGRN